MVMIIVVHDAVVYFGHRQAEMEAGMFRVLGASLGGEKYAVHQQKRSGLETRNPRYLLLSQFPLYQHGHIINSTLQSS